MRFLLNIGSKKLVNKACVESPANEIDTFETRADPKKSIQCSETKAPVKSKGQKRGVSTFWPCKNIKTAKPTAAKPVR